MKSFKVNCKVLIMRNKTSRDSLRFPTPTRQFVLDWFKEQIKRHDSPMGLFPPFLVQAGIKHNTSFHVALSLSPTHPVIPQKNPKLTPRGPSGDLDFGCIPSAELLWFLPSHSLTFLEILGALRSPWVKQLGCP